MFHAFGDICVIALALALALDLVNITSKYLDSRFRKFSYLARDSRSSLCVYVFVYGGVYGFTTIETRVRHQLSITQSLHRAL